MTDYILTSIFIYLIIGIPIMLYKFQDLSASLQQIYFSWVLLASSSFQIYKKLHNK